MDIGINYLYKAVQIDFLLRKIVSQYIDVVDLRMRQ